MGTQRRSLVLRFGDEPADPGRAILVLVRHEVRVKHLRLDAMAGHGSRLRMLIEAVFADELRFLRVTASLSRLCGVVEIAEPCVV